MTKWKSFFPLALAIFSACVVPDTEGAILARLKNGENLKIAAVGTSLTDKGFNHNHGWFEQTGEWLNGLSYSGKVILANRAVCGSASKTDASTTDSRDGLRQLSDVLVNDDPDAVFIEFGINDAYTPYHISEQSSRDNLQVMIDQIRTWAQQQNQGKGKLVDIVVQTMNNCSGAEASKRPNLAIYYEGYRQVAQANSGVLFIDHYSNWLALYESQTNRASWKNYVPDTIHPNDVGAREIILPELKAALRRQVSADSGGTANHVAMDPTAELDRCNVVWNSPSTNSAGSMPLGNGDIGLNVWVEENGDLVFFVSKTDAWSDCGRLLKLGQVRLRLTPALAARPFHQELELRQGRMVVCSGAAGSVTTLRLWIDAHHPVIHIEGESQQDMQAQVGLKVWRTADRDLRGNSSAGYISESSSPIIEKADTVLPQKSNRIIWYHRNELTIVPLTMKLQGVASLLPLVHDPLLHNTFGGCISGKGFVQTEAGDMTQALKTVAPTRHFDLTIDVLTAQTDTAEQWLKKLDVVIAENRKPSLNQAWEAHCKWWQDFWERSWIYVRTPEDGVSLTPEQEATRRQDRDDLQLLGHKGIEGVRPAVSTEPAGIVINRGYALQRFISAAGWRGAYPVKHNGSIFGVNDRNHESLEDADDRTYGANYWILDTTTTTCGPMLSSGDYDLLQPLFRMYTALVPMARERTKLSFKHEGFFIPATVYPWGTYQDNEYVRWLWHGGLELTAKMLDYYEATEDQAFLRDTLLPFAEGVATFYDQHYKRDELGKIRIEPACALESVHNAINPLPEIAGLHYVLPRLLSLPDKTTTAAQRAVWTKTLADLPPVPTRGEGDKKICVAAEVIKGRQGDELPELYAVFPYRLYAIGCPDFDLGRRSVEAYVPLEPRTKYPFEGMVGGWRLNLVQVAFVGKAKQAARMVTSNFASHDPGSRFPAFWGPNQVGLPDQSHGGITMTALQAMLMQVNGRKIYLFPACPKEWDVNFKLHALYNTTVEGELRDGKVISLKVTPHSRAADLINMLEK